MTARTDLATWISAELSSPHPEVSVVSFDAGIVKLPAVVIVNGDPMLEIDSLGGRVGWTVEAHVYVAAAGNEATLELLEELVLAVYRAGITGGRFLFRSASRPDVVEYSGLEALRATVTFTQRLQPTTAP